MIWIDGLQAAHKTNLQIIRQEIDVPRIQKSPNYVRRLQISNSFCVLLNGTRKISFAVQMISVLFKNVGQPFRVVLMAFGNPYGNVIQILFE